MEHVIVSKTLKKACNCKGTSSGPRITMKNSSKNPEGYVVDLEEHAMVCDVCDTPWVIEKTAKKIV